jgi:hypothetical protein
MSPTPLLSGVDDRFSLRIFVHVNFSLPSAPLLPEAPKNDGGMHLPTPTSNSRSLIMTPTTSNPFCFDFYQFRGRGIKPSLVTTV